MGKGNLRRKQVSGRGKVEGFAIAQVTVRNSQGELLNGVSVEIVGVPPQPGQRDDDFKGTTGKAISRNKDDKINGIPGTGVWFSGPALPGKFDIVVSLSEYGPPAPIVSPAAVRRNVELVSAFELPGNQTRVAVNFVLDPRNPRVVVKVRDGTFKSANPVANADVEVIGVAKGKTDRFGEFRSPPAPLGKIGVNVSSPGMLSTATGSAVSFTEIDINPRGTAGAGSGLPEGVIDPSTRDAVVSVELTSQSVILPGTHPRPFALWASGTASGHPVADDARLPAPGAGDTDQGQDGWDLGVVFTNLADLAQKLNGRLELPDRLGGGTIEARQLKRLAICSHGFNDTIDVDQRTTGGAFGLQPDENNSLTPARFDVYKRSLETIGNALAKDATVILACCLVARTGEELMRFMSFLWPTVTIVGLRTIGVLHPKQRIEQSIDNLDRFPGVRDSPFVFFEKNLSEKERTERQSAVFNAPLSRLPWLSERSPHATIVRNGTVLRRGNTPQDGEKL